MKALPKYFTCLLLALAGVSAGGFSTAFAGPEVLSSAKDKNPIVEIPTCKPTFYMTISGGADFDIGSTDINKPRTEIINSGFPFIGVFVKGHEFDDVFDDVGFHVHAELGFAVGNYWEFFVLGQYEHVDADGFTSGSHLVIDGSPIFFIDVPFRSKFENYSSWGAEFGARFYFLSRQARFRPYASISGGPSYANSVDIHTYADLTSIGGPPDALLFRGKYLADSFIGTATGLLGLEYAINCHWSVGVEAGIHYTSVLDDDDRGFQHFTALGVPVSFLRSINNDVGDRLVIPANGYVKFRW